MKVCVFDADGVLAVPSEPFSYGYARRNSIPIDLFQKFFREEFPRALVGQADLKDLLTKHSDTWQVGTPEEIMREWFDAENIQAEQALKVVHELKSRGHNCYLATNQEQYRGNFMKTVMFPGLFDGYFISGEMGVKKPETGFFQQVIVKLQDDMPGITPEEITFFDDTLEHVEGAKQVGIDARHYTHVDQLLELL